VKPNNQHQKDLDSESAEWVVKSYPISLQASELNVPMNSRQTEANAMMEPYRREFAEWYSFFGLASQEAQKTHRIH